MAKNCNLELRLVPSNDSEDYQQEEQTERPAQQEEHQQKQQLTIFYNGKVFVWDVTEVQARAIIMHATRGMDEKFRNVTGSPAGPTSSSVLPMPSCKVDRATVLPMKRSLQRFLQKRNHRINNTASPYNANQKMQAGGKLLSRCWSERN